LCKSDKLNIEQQGFLWSLLVT